LTMLIKLNILSNSIRYFGRGLVMDYKALAEELFHIMTRTAKLPFQKKVDDLSHGERRILGYLTFGKNGVPSGDLSDKLDLTTPRVASALNSLAKKGYIERNRDENDKRMVIVSITEAGKSFMMEEYNKLISMMQQTLERLGENDAQELIRIIKRIKEITNEMSEQECRQD
jgi:MarR family transcriptional regulator, organic hydroperoxide resistance regulator